MRSTWMILAVIAGLYWASDEDFGVSAEEENPCTSPNLSNAISDSDYCYAFAKASTTRDKAREMCERLGGHLLVIDTEAEQNLFTLQLQIQRRDKAWIDLKRTGPYNDEWEWGSEGKPVTYDLPEEKDGRTGPIYEECGVITQHGDWEDEQCNARFSFGCRALKKNAKVVKPPPEPCAKGFEDWLGEEGDYCYKLDDSRPDTWQVALQKCRSEGATLIRTTNQKEIEALGEHMTKANIHSIWLDLKKTGPSDDDWTWNSNGVRPNETALGWDEGQPHNRGGDACAVQWDGNRRWYDFRCISRFDYGCMVEKVRPETTTASTTTTEPPTTTVDINDYCPCPGNYEGWVDEYDYCYLIHQDGQGNFTEAEDVCSGEYLGGSLAFIPNAKVNDAIAKKLEENNYERAILDLQGKTVWDSWHYAKLALNYTSWDVDATKDRCAFMQPSGEWDNLSCGEKSTIVCSAKRVCGE